MIDMSQVLHPELIVTWLQRYVLITIIKFNHNIQILQRTTPKSPNLSVRKRGEFTEKTHYNKTTEEIELEKAAQNEFKARPVPKKIFSDYKPIAGRTPSEKKTSFKEFNLSQVKQKQILTTEELELQNN